MYDGAADKKIAALFFVYADDYIFLCATICICLKNYLQNR